MIEHLEQLLEQSNQRRAALQQQADDSTSRELATRQELEQQRSHSNQLEQQVLSLTHRVDSLGRDLEAEQLLNRRLHDALAEAASLRQEVAHSQQAAREARQIAQRDSARAIELEQQLSSSHQRILGERTVRLELEQRVEALTHQLEEVQAAEARARAERDRAISSTSEAEQRVEALALQLEQAAQQQAEMQLKLNNNTVQVNEERFMSARCKDSDDFAFIDANGAVVGDDDANANDAKLGQGANGVALRCRCIVPGHPRPHQRYALKVCFNFDSSAHGTFVNEFMELVKLPSHPNIVRFVCQFVAEVRHVSRFLPDFVAQHSPDGRPLKTQFFALELMSTSLASLLRDRGHRGVSQREASLIIAQVGSALRHLESHRVAHRDIKLDNVLVELTNDERREIKRCVIGDFGTACELDENLCSTMAVSNTGLLLTPKWGNDAHIAPELHSLLGSTLKKRRAATIEMDYSRQGVFELGVLAFEVLIGSGPIEEYPSSVTNREGVVEYSDDRIASIIDRQPPPSSTATTTTTTTTIITREQEAMLKLAVSCDASRRPSLEEMIDCFDRDRSLRMV